MIVGTELLNWLQDPAACRRAVADKEAFALAWQQGPYVQSVRTALARAQGRRAEAIALALRKLFENCEWTCNLIEELSAALRHDLFFDPPFPYLNSDIHKGLVLFENDLASVAVGTTDILQLAARKNAARDKTSIVFSGQLEVFRFVKAGRARLAFWTAPTIQADFTGASAAQCSPAGRRWIDDGETVVVDGRRESFVIEHAATSSLVLQATVKLDRAPVSVEYDSETREYVGCSAADDSASRIQMITTLLRKLDHRAAFPAIAEFLDHPSFFVRWHVMRELLGLDVEAALPHLKRMAARDPHPETRRAARSVLDRIEGPDPGRRKAA